MATLTNDQLLAMNFGYLTGADLAQWSPMQLLIKQWETNNMNLQNGCSQAYSEVINLFRTKYDIAHELNMISGPRETSFVKLVSIMAVRNILGNMAGIGEPTKMAYDWADSIVHQTQSGLFQFALNDASIRVRSGSFLVGQNFGTLG